MSPTNCAAQHFLAWRRGEGAVRLLGRDGHRMLLEYAGEHLCCRTICDEQGDNAATAIAAEVMARLLSPSQHPAPPDLQPLADAFCSLFRKAEADRAAGHDQPLCRGGRTSRSGCSPIRATSRPLHGDLHHENIMHGPRGWLAIDPKGVLGDPGFDAANLFYNPLDRDDLCLDPTGSRIMAEIFAGTLGQDAGRHPRPRHRLWLPVGRVARRGRQRSRRESRAVDREEDPGGVARFLTSDVMDALTLPLTPHSR